MACRLAAPGRPDEGVLRHTATAQDAEDVVHEAMTRAVESSGIDDDKLAPWLMRVTVRLCADIHRERVREQRRWFRLSAPAEAVSPDERICDQAEAAWVAEHLSRLPSRQAAALRLRAEGLTVEQVARRLDLSYRTTESLLARARSTLRAVLVSALGLAIACCRWAADFARLTTAQPALVVAAAVTVAAVFPPVHHAAAPPRPSRPQVLSGTAPSKAPAVPAPSPLRLPRSRSAEQVPSRAVPPTAADRPSSGVTAPTPVLTSGAGPLTSPPAVLAVPTADLVIPRLRIPPIGNPSEPETTGLPTTPGVPRPEASAPAPPRSLTDHQKKLCGPTDG